MNDKIKNHIQEGDKAAQQKDWDTALNWYERALEFSPFENEIHEKIIHCHINRKDRKRYLEAVNRYRNAKNSAPIPQQTLSHKLIEPPKPQPTKPEPTKPEPPKPEPPKPEPTKPEPPKPQPTKPEPPKPEPTKPEPPKPQPTKPEPPKPQPTKPEPPKPQPTKPEPPKPEPTKKTKEIPLFSTIESAPSLKRSSDISEAEMIEADAEQWEKRGEKETASKSYAQAAYLWKQKGDNARAGLAYEKSYEFSPNPEILTQLNELYSQGVKLKQSTVMEIYKKIYHMKI
jgi:tetratricopeptide (TPR) repeat protein